MEFHFPLIDPVKHWELKHYLNKVREECSEFEEEKDPERQAKEVVDILHAAETLVRKYFERNTIFTLEEIKTATVKKNRDRGYYG